MSELTASMPKLKDVKPYCLRCGKDKGPHGYYCKQCLLKIELIRYFSKLTLSQLEFDNVG